MFLNLNKYFIILISLNKILKISIHLPRTIDHSFKFIKVRLISMQQSLRQKK